MGVNDQKSLELDLIKTFLNDIGLGNSVHEILVSHPHIEKPNICLRLDLDITIHEMMMTNQPIMKYLERQYKNVKNSPLVRDEVVGLRETIESMKKGHASLLEEIAELKKYKNHFDIQMALNHGEKKDE